MSARSKRRQGSSSAAKSGKEKAPSRAASASSDPAVPKTTQALGKLRFAGPLLLISGAALILRLMHVWQTGAVPSAVELMGDAKGYYDWASRIAGGEWYGEETFYQAPLYPYFLAVLMTLGAKSILAIRVCQCLLGTAAVALLGFATRRRFGDAAGLVGATILAVLPAAIYYDGLIQKASLASFLLCLFLFVIARWGISASGDEPDADQAPYPSLASFFAAGISLALLVLVRENTLLWTPLPLLWLWLHRLRISRAKEVADSVSEAPLVSDRARASAAYLAGLACILFPVAARNASLGGEWSPTTFQAGPNFYIGNHAEANGLYQPLVPGHETPLHERSDAVRLAEQESGQELSAREVSQFWFRKAFDEIQAAPGRWVELMAIKSLMVVNFFEVPDVESMMVYRESSIVLLMFDRFLHFGALGVFAAVGLVLTRGQWREQWLWFALIGTLIAATVGFFILGRYRFPLVPLLIPLASVGIVRSCLFFREKRFSGLVVPALAAVSAGVLCHLPIHDTHALNANSIANVGAAAASRGDMELGIKLLRRALQEDADIPEAHVNLGRALMIEGNLGAAISEFRIALTQEPNLVDVDYFLATALERTGDLRAALYHYQRAFAMDPSNARVREAIARLQGASSAD
ncbi:MAG: tetratricopeptide repeat protein [Planctomycetota bacterium]